MYPITPNSRTTEAKASTATTNQLVPTTNPAPSFSRQDGPVSSRDLARWFENAAAEIRSLWYLTRDQQDAALRRMAKYTLAVRLNVSAEFQALRSSLALPDAAARLQTMATSLRERGAFFSIQALDGRGLFPVQIPQPTSSLMNSPGTSLRGPSQVDDPFRTGSKGNIRPIDSKIQGLRRTLLGYVDVNPILLHPGHTAMVHSKQTGLYTGKDIHGAAGEVKDLFAFGTSPEARSALFTLLRNSMSGDMDRHGFRTAVSRRTDLRDVLMGARALDALHQAALGYAQENDIQSLGPGDESSVYRDILDRYIDKNHRTGMEFMLTQPEGSFTRLQSPSPAATTSAPTVVAGLPQPDEPLGRQVKRKAELSVGPGVLNGDVKQARVDPQDGAIPKGWPMTTADQLPLRWESRVSMRQQQSPSQDSWLPQDPTAFQTSAAMADPNSRHFDFDLFAHAMQPQMQPPARMLSMDLSPTTGHVFQTDSIPSAAAPLPMRQPIPATANLAAILPTQLDAPLSPAQRALSTPPPLEDPLPTLEAPGEAGLPGSPRI